TVGLAGEGFELHVREGQRVRAGDRLISFDLDLLARRAKSLVTPVILTDTGGFSVVGRSQDRTLNVGDVLMEIVQTVETASADTVPPIQPPVGVEGNVVVPLEHGIHARPAASLAAALKNLAAEVSIAFGGRKVNARSPVALMSL